MIDHSKDPTVYLGTSREIAVKKKLAIVISHPIQYNAPWFRLLAERNKVQVKVFYTLSQSKDGAIYDSGFEKKFEWDIPLLSGYENTFVRNVASRPRPHYFFGISNPTLIQEIDDWNADAILVFGWLYKSHLKLLHHFHNRKLVLFRGDSTVLRDSGLIRSVLRKLFLTWVYSMVDYAFYVGENNKAYYSQYGLKENQLIFAPHAIDNLRFSENKESHQRAADEWRRRMGIRNDDIVFLYAGKLEPIKHPELLLEAFAELKVPNTHLVMGGNGRLERDLKTSFSDVSNLHFIDFQNQSQMPVVYHLCDVFVLPSKSETWGLAINEAMACGKAVLVSDKCGAAVDLIKEGINGLTFKSQNKENLKNKMRALMKEKAELRKMGEASFSIIQHYSFKHICIAVEDLLSSS